MKLWKAEVLPGRRLKEVTFRTGARPGDKSARPLAPSRDVCPGERFDVPDIVFVEIEYALRKHYGLSRSEMARVLQAFVAHPKISSNTDLLDAIWRYYESSPALSFTDIALAAYAQMRRSEPLWTFDKKLVR